MCIHELSFAYLATALACFDLESLREEGRDIDLHNELDGGMAGGRC